MTSHCGRNWRTPNPASATTTSTAVTQVITFSEVGARSRRRALATARLLCLMSWRGTTGNVPVGGPVARRTRSPPAAAADPSADPGNLPGLGEGPEMVGTGGHRGHHVGHGAAAVAVAGDAAGDADQASIIRRARASPSSPRKAA